MGIPTTGVWMPTGPPRLGLASARLRRDFALGFGDLLYVWESRDQSTGCQIEEGQEEATLS